MRTYVFLSLPGHGHVNPTLSVAAELKHRGNRVIYYSLDAFREKIEATGVEYRSYNATSIDPKISKNAALFAKELIRMTNHLTPQLIQALAKDNPDCILYDTFGLWGKATASALHIPAIALHTTFAFNTAVIRKYFPVYLGVLSQALLKKDSLITSYYHYTKIAKRYQFNKRSINEFLFSVEKLNLVFTSKSFQPYAERFDDTYQFVGPSVYPRKEKISISKELQEDKKLIYISLGSIFNDDLAFFRLCLATFGHTDYQVVVSLGHRLKITDLPKIPDNILVRNYIPQLEVLEKASVFITHAGMNSVNESLMHGVPMVLVPQMHEQTINALRVQELGAGIYLKKGKITKETLLNTVEKILRSKSFSTQSTLLKKSLIEAGGYKKAAELIEVYCK